MTVVIPSYQRRESLRRLLEVLALELGASRVLRVGLDLVVVLDGSTDGSYELVRKFNMPIPLRATTQPNRGYAAARNCGVRQATGELVLFLDDDVIPTEGMIARHREAHKTGRPTVVVGNLGFRGKREKKYVLEGVSRRIERLDQFRIANTSGPLSVWRDVGGFDEELSGWGMEDWELAARLLEHDVPITLDPQTVAWHDPVEFAALDESELFELYRRRHREMGRSAVKLAARHLWTADQLFSSYRSARLLGALRIRCPRSLWATSTVVSLAVKIAAPIVGFQQSRRLRDFAVWCAYAAGVGDEDVEQRFLPRMLGVRTAGRPS